MRFVVVPSLLALALAAQDGFSVQEVGDVAYEGLIEAHRTIELAAAVDGLLEEVTVERGDVVTKGQVLARLESSVEEATLELATARAGFVANLDAARARLEFNSRKLKQDEKLFQKGIISEQEIDQSRTDQKLAASAVLQAQETMRLNELEKNRSAAALALRTITSPIDGVVVDRFLSPGELITRQVQTKILQLAQIDPLNVEVILPVGVYGQIKIGATATVHPEAPVGGQYIARVTVVDRVVDAASGTFRVRLELPNADNKLPAGLKCTVRFQK